MTKFSLVIPVYRNEESLPDLLKRVTSLYERLHRNMEAVFVVDGSPDRCGELLTKLLANAVFPSQLIFHARNFGSFAAIMTGIRQASGPFYAVMAADLQEPEDLIIDFFTNLETENWDVVVGSRESRNDPILSRLASDLFWKTYRLAVISEIPKGGVDIFGCNDIFKHSLVEFGESNTSLVGLIYWLGFRRKEIQYSRVRRERGKSAWTFRKKYRYLMDSIFSFTDLPIRILSMTGVAGVTVSASLGLFAVAARVLGLQNLPGFATTVVSVSFFASLNMLGIGIVGSYVWRAYENTKHRPNAVVARTIKMGVSSEPKILSA